LADSADQEQGITLHRRNEGMSATKYVLFKYCRYGGVFAEDYWTGIMLDDGRPARTSMIAKAMTFDTSREAYDYAGQYKKMDWWQAGERRVSVLH